MAVTWKNLGKPGRAFVALAVSLIVAGCTGSIEGVTDGEVDGSDELGDALAGVVGADLPPVVPDVPMIETALSELDGDLLAPERGYYAGVDLLNDTSMHDVRADGYSLAIAVVRLDDYRYKALDQAFFDRLQAGFDAGAAAGIKFILRFSYNASFTDDAPLSRVLQHIGQLAPYLQANADVISVVQAGFIGAWGEWHGSTNGLESDESRRQILDALLAAVPTDRFIQVRTPMYKDSAYPGGPVDATMAFTAEARARIGHHNDCFLASDDDLGTYASPMSQWQGYVANDTLHVPMGGETCALYTPRTNCGTALGELEMLHWSYLNSEYHRDVINSWTDQGCAEEVEQRLGYRLAATRVAHAETAVAGGTLPVVIDLVNRGFSAPFNERPVYLVLRGAGGRVAHKVLVDPRRWHGGSVFRVAANLPLPTDLAPGTYSLGLWLPDAAPGLADDPRYAVPLANPDVWDADTGENLLTDTVVISG